jgi:hypothetical protein
MRKIISYFRSLMRRREAKREGVPYEKRMWYNYRAMLSKDELAGKSFIEIFDKSGSYINCPGIGGTVIYNNKGRHYLYEIVGFKNESRYSDWLYDGDWINPIVRYVGKVKEE